MSSCTVKFPMSAEIWRTVVEEAEDAEYINVEEENTEFFTVQYVTEPAWRHATTRFNGLIPYDVVRPFREHKRHF